MKYIAIMDTSILSFNLGDQIIMDCARKALEPVTRDAFVVSLPTHSPLFHRSEFSIRCYDSFHQNLDKFDYKFVCGTNLLAKNMKLRKPAWNLRKRDLKYVHDFILAGVGTDDLPAIANHYTREFYDKALSHKYVHSTRDERTKVLLENLGFRAVNTGCITLWNLDEQKCSEIPVGKSECVVFTVTDYAESYLEDKKMIDILLDEYREVSCWIQGISDLEYLKKLGVLENKRIRMIKPSLKEYDEYLENHICDYVGTRLHAGIRAMQKGRRALIIGVDNRARDMNENYPINYLHRKSIDELRGRIHLDIRTKIGIDRTKINRFIGQFIDRANY